LTIPLLASAASTEETARTETTSPSSPQAERPLVVPSGQTPPAGSASRGVEGPGLDALLHVPSRFLEGESSSVAGAGESEWRRRFDKAYDDLDEARALLERTKQELDGVAEGGGASQWSVAAPGGGAPAGGAGSTSPLSFKLRQELKRNRELVEQAERSLRELRIEADLAGVPSSWRGVPRPLAQPELAN
jgi:hypothetical protein